MFANMFLLIVESLGNTDCSGNIEHKNSSIIRAIYPSSSKLLLSPASTEVANFLPCSLKTNCTANAFNISQFLPSSPSPCCMWHSSALTSLRLHLACSYEPGQRCLPCPVPVLGWDMSAHHPLLLPGLLQGEAQGTEPDVSWGCRAIGAHSWCPSAWTGAAFEYFGFGTLVPGWQRSLKTHRKISQTIIIIITFTAPYALNP